MAKKKLTKKQKLQIRKDVLVSVLIASVLFNLFFIVGLVLFTATNTLDKEVYEVAYSNLCDTNYVENKTEFMENSDNPALAALKFDVECRTDGFFKYYQNAYEAYLSDQL